MRVTEDATDLDPSNLHVNRDLHMLADVTRIERPDDDYWYPDRTELLETALDTKTQSVSTGGYQGTMVFVFVYDGHLWVLKESYGSCSHCDGLLAAKSGPRRSDTSDETELDALRDYTKKMLKNAYAFETASNAIRYVHHISDRGYGWDKLDEEAIKLIAELDLDDADEML